MNKRWKIAAVLAVIMVALASNVMGQVNPPAAPPVSSGDQATDGKSNTNRATAGLFSEERDNYLSTTGISGMTKNLIFVNLFNLNYFGGPGVDTEVPSPPTYPPFNTPYFDAGMGLFLGTNWLGAAFTYGVTENIDLLDYASKQVTTFPDGSIDTTTTTERATTVTYEVSDWFRLNAVFGNKVWGIKNSFDLTNRKAEGYYQPSVTTTITVGGLNLSTGSITPAAIGTNNATTTTSPGGVTSNELQKGETLASKIGDTIEFGIHLDQVVQVLAPFTPWATAKIGYTYTDYTNYLVASTGVPAATPAYTYKGYGWEYYNRDALETREAYSYAHDKTAAEGYLLIGLGAGAKFKLNDIFALSPGLSYDIGFSLYANKYTDHTGGEEKIAGIGESYYGKSYVNEGYYLAPEPQYSGTQYTQIEQRAANTYELSHINQVLKPSVKLNAAFGRLNFAVKYTPQLTFNNRSQTYTQASRTVTVKKFGTDKYKSYTETVTTTSPELTGERSLVQWDNTFDFGAQIWLVPEKFRLNVGSKFATRIGNWTTTKWTSNNTKSTVVTEKVYDDGHKDDSTNTTTVISGGTVTEQQRFQSNGLNTAVTYGFGATFFLNENVNFDFYLANQSGATVDSWLSVLMPATWALQFNIRY